MLKKIITALGACMLIFGICAGAAEDEVITSVNDTGEALEVTFTAPKSGDIYVIGALRKTDGTLYKAAVDYIENAVEGEPYEAKLDGIRSGADIYIWDDKQMPLCNVYPTETTGDGIIHLKETEIDAAGITGVEVDGNIVTITAAGDYIIEGTLNDGQIVVSDSLGKKDAVNITLQGVNVTCSNSAPFNGGGGKIGITLAEGTINTFADSGKYTDYTTSKDPKGCFYSRRDLDIGGSGTLVINGNVKNGLVCGADLKIKKNANLDVTAVNNAVKGDNGVEFTNKTGAVNITAGGDGIKSDAIDTDILATGAIEADNGYVIIAGGTFTINADGDGIQADNYCTITGGDITINSGTEGIKANEVNLYVIDGDENVVDGEYINGKIAISGGTLDITAGEDGIKAAERIDISDGTIYITTDRDGIQSGKAITEENDSGEETETYSRGDLEISGGTINITTGGGNSVSHSDDESRKGIKANTYLNITGGDITIDSADDCIHSNWDVTITGGKMTLSTGDDGVHADRVLTLGTEGGSDEDYTINISTSYEGIEGSLINIFSGTTYLFATDDGVNAAGDYKYNSDGEDITPSSVSIEPMAGPGANSGNQGGNPPGGPGNTGGGTGDRGPGGGSEDSPYGLLVIKGGRTYVEAEGDGLDSNGDAEMSGGIVLVNGPTSGANGVFDKDGTFTVSGGTLIGAGTREMSEEPTVTGQAYVLKNNGSGNAGNPVSVTTDSGDIKFIPKTSWQWIFITAPEMTSGKTYTLNTNADSTGEQVFGRTVGGTFYGLIK